MARFGTWMPIARYQPGGSVHTPMTPRRLIFHTAVTSASSLYGSMSQSGTATSHFYVAADGTCEQYIDTSARSSANLNGNHDCITVETQDMGVPFPSWSGSNVPPWTDEQLDTLVRMAQWARDAHGIPLERLESSRPGTRGIGWHRLGIDGNFPSGVLGGRVSGGELWSGSSGKACPGDKRIMQTVEVIIPRARGAEPEGDDMAEAKQEIIAEIRKVKELINTRFAGERARDKEMAGVLDEIAADVSGLPPEFRAALKAKLDKLKTALTPKPE